MPRDESDTTPPGTPAGTPPDATPAALPGAPQLAALRVFVHVARAGSFAGAARELGLSPAAVSQAVARLEEGLQAALFVRAVRRISLTPAGASLFAATDVALRDIELALKAAGPRTSALVRLTAPPTWVALWLMPRLAGFTQAAPHVQVQVDASSQLQDIEAQGIDFGIRYAQALPPHFKRVGLFDQVFVPVCHPSLAQQLHSLADLQEQRLLHESDLSRWTGWLNAAAADAGEEPPAWDGANGLYFSQGTLAVSAASRGLGVALTEPGFVAGASGVGHSGGATAQAMVQPFAFGWHTGNRYHAVWSSRSPLSAAARQFLDWLKAEAKSEPKTDTRHAV